MVAQELKLSEGQRNRLADAERMLDEGRSAHEKMRDLVVTSGSRDIAGEKHFEWISHVTRLQEDFNEYLRIHVDTFAEAAWPLGKINAFKTYMENRASELLRHAVAKVHRQDFFMLNEDTLRPVIRARLDAWVQKAEAEMLPPWMADEQLESEATAHPPMPPVRTTLAENIDRCRKECGWSFDELARRTGMDKTSILRHVNEGARPRPANLRLYTEAFSKKLNRPVLVADLEG